MASYSFQPRDRIFVKGYGFCLLLEICENVSKNLGSKHSEKLIEHTKQFATDAFKTVSKRAIQKPAEATGYFDWKQN